MSVKVLGCRFKRYSGPDEWVRNLLEEIPMPWADRQMSNSMVGALPRGIRVPEAGIELTPYRSLRSFHITSLQGGEQDVESPKLPLMQTHFPSEKSRHL